MTSGWALRPKGSSRNLISAPQFASYDIMQAALTGSPATIVNAIRYGVVEVGTATIEFRFAVAQSLIDAVIGSQCGRSI